MIQRDENKILVGKKDANAYLMSALICLQRDGFAVIEGLGRQGGKVLGIARALVELRRAKIADVESFALGETHGIRIKLEEVDSNE